MGDPAIFSEIIKTGGVLAALVVFLIYLNEKDKRLSKTLDQSSKDHSDAMKEVAQTHSTAMSKFAESMNQQNATLGKLVGIVQARLSTLVEGD